MGKSYRIRLAESSLERAARMLTDDNDVNVIFRGDQAYTDGKTICLPTVSSDAPDEYVEVMTGLLYHQAGLKIFSDPLTYPIDSPQYFQCVKMCEAVRTEARLVDRYPGAQSSLESYHNFTANILHRNWVKSTQLERVLNGFFYTQTYGKESSFYQGLDTTTREWVDAAMDCTGPCQELQFTKDAEETGDNLADLLKPLFEDHQKSVQQSSNNLQESTSFGLQQQSEESKELAKELREVDGDEGEKSDALQAELQDLNGDGTYRIYSTENDVVEKIPMQENEQGHLVSALRQTTADIVVTMRRKLINTLRVLTEAKWSRGHDEGELDTDVLYELPTRISEHVFKQRVKNMELDVAVSLAIDHSGSMGQEKMTLATQCAITLGDVLAAMNIPFQAYGFSTINKVPDHCPKDVAKTYARWNALWIGVYHDFNDQWREGAMRMSTMMGNKKQNTLDGESVLWGLRQLLMRREKRKILFVLTDGQPEPGAGHKGRCSDHLKAVTQMASAVGVEVVGFGIQSRTVKIYYPHHVILTNMTDIVKEPLTKLDDALRKGRRFR